MTPKEASKPTLAERVAILLAADNRAAEEVRKQRAARERLRDVFERPEGESHLRDRRGW